MVAMARMSGLSQSEIPPTVQKMISGLAPHIPGQTVCSRGHENVPGGRFCSSCGVQMSAPVPRHPCLPGRPGERVLPGRRGRVHARPRMPGLRRRPAGPGRGCEACGTFPAVTAPELEADLTGTRTLAVVHAAKLRAEASELRSQALAKHSETDRVLHVARLEERLALARLALDDATAGQPPLEAGLKRARKAEDRAARELAGASEDHARIEKAEETARRIRHGLEAETAATLQLAAAGDVLRRYQTALAEAAASGRKQRPRWRPAGNASRSWSSRDEAAAAVADPGRIRLSAETVAASSAKPR
jgi:hypothetical protein